ncbi:MAG: hypothetical protein GY943_17915 [Chloroflexi bacterium]|nr:hypothetical protein [Chloroflexota bacterium]
MKEKNQNGLEKLAVLGLIIILFLTITGNVMRFIFAPIMNDISVEIEREFDHEFTEEEMEAFAAEMETLGEELGAIGEELGEEFGAIGEEIGEEIGAELEREFEQLGEELEREVEYGR